jgi:glycosyltransferase involved in cell wall biosynthesis
MFNSIREFANKSIEIISNPEIAKELAEQQFSYANEHYNIEKNITVIEDLYTSIYNSKTP